MSARLTGLLLGSLLCLSCGAQTGAVAPLVGAPQEEIWLNEHDQIEDAEVAQGKLWIRTDFFSLWALDLSTKKPESFIDSQRWFFLQKLESGRLFALSREPWEPGRPRSRPFVLWELRDGRWVPLLQRPEQENEIFQTKLPILGVFERGDDLGLVSSSGVQLVGKNGQISEEIRFPKPLLRGQGPMTPLVRSGFLYVGEPARYDCSQRLEDHCPFRGGALWRIDMRSWKSEQIDNLSPSMLMPDPSHPRCLLATIARADDIASGGGVVRVCGKSTRWIFREALDEEFSPPRGGQDAVQDPWTAGCSRPVRKACSTPGALIVDLGNDFRRVTDGRSERVAQPEMRRVARLNVSREIPGALAISELWPIRPKLVCLDAPAKP